MRHAPTTFTTAGGGFPCFSISRTLSEVVDSHSLSSTIYYHAQPFSDRQAKKRYFTTGYTSKTRFIVKLRGLAKGPTLPLRLLLCAFQPVSCCHGLGKRPPLSAEGSPHNGECLKCGWSVRSTRQNVSGAFCQPSEFFSAWPWGLSPKSPINPLRLRQGIAEKVADVSSPPVGEIPSR